MTGRLPSPEAIDARERAAADAANPNTPAPRLREAMNLGAVKAVLKNPSLPLVLLEQPDFWKGLQTHVLQQVADSRHCPEGFVAWAIEAGQEAVLGPLLRNRRVPAALRRRAFLSLWYPVATASWEATQPWLAAILSASERRLLERGIRKEALSPAEFEALTKLGVAGRAVLSAHPDTPRSLRQQVSVPPLGTGADAMETYDCDFVIIGSGFGGSVSALRLSEKGYKVIVLEAGKRWAKEDFPKTNWNVRKFLWAPEIFCHGIQRLTLLKDTLILSGAGVGGGSLVYANTLLVPGPDAFANPGWPSGVNWRDELMPFYDTAKRMLGVAKNPKLWKADEQLKEIATELGRGDTFHSTNVAVLFAKKNQQEGEAVPDPFFGGQGPARTTCTHCGGCMVGCRPGAKNTLDKNYLYLAEQRGAEIQPESQVTDIEELDGGGYEIRIEKSTSILNKHRRTLKARGVIFSAGVLGTVKLLHKAKSKGHLKNVSEQLGNFVRTNSEVILGVTADQGGVDYSKGIAISSGMYPDANTHIEPVRYSKGSDVMGMLGTIMVDDGPGMPRWLRWLGKRLSHPIDAIRSIIPFKFAERSTILLVMQTVDNYMKLGFKHGRLQSDWAPGQTKPPSYIPIANEVGRKLAAKMGGTARNALNEAVLNVPTTAHILGGCTMADAPAQGVIDRDNKVFGYEQMYVIDGSMVPSNLGVNPSLTITAMAERAMSKLPKRADNPAFSGLAVPGKPMPTVGPAPVPLPILE